MSIPVSTVALLTRDARDLEVEVAHPAVRAKGIILFSHGANASPDRYQAIVAAWATGGYWVLSPLHLDSERHPQRETRDRARILSTRLEDMRTVIAAAATSGRGTALARDLRNTAKLPMFAAGHSYGAYVAQIAGGATVLDAAGARLTLAPQPRLRGVVALSPPPTAAGFSPPGSWSTLRLPMLVETGTTDILPPFVTRWQQHLDSHADAPQGQSWPAVYVGIDHYFGGLIGRLSSPPEAAAERQLARFAALSLSFMRRAGSGRLRGFDSDIARLSDRPLVP